MITRPYIWLYISLLTIVTSALIMVITPPVWGIDFVGGSLLEIPGSPDRIDRVKTIFVNDLHLPVSVQSTPQNSLIIRTSALNPTQHQEVIKKLQEQQVLAGETLRFESIGPTIGKELRQKAWIATLLVVVIMIVYLAYEFRGVARFIAPWKFGVAAAYALVHDLIIITALFFLLGKYRDVPIDTLFVTAQLAVLGYSVNDTIIIFNRFKHEWMRSRGDNLINVMEKATKLTLTRSLNTSLTILLTLLALLFLGGESIRWFIVALVAGTIIGTYSSIFVATPFLYWLAKR